jgi:DNA-binding NarL/FixJ family response regulator
MIRVVVVDDHPAIRAGLLSVLRTEPGLVPVGGAGGDPEVWPVLYRARPDVVLLDYQLKGDDGLAICHRLKRGLLPPRVVVYSAYADGALAIPAAVAGADGVVSKDTPVTELFEAIRRVVNGETVWPPMTAEARRLAAERLDAEDVPVLAMLLGGHAPADIAEALRCEIDAVGAAIERILGRLRGPVAGAL